MTELKKDSYKLLINELKKTIYRYQLKTLKSINNEVINLYFDKLKDENPSIGIIICKSKDKTYVKYALRNANSPIGVATYRIETKLPKEIESLLPSPEDIVKKLKLI